MKNILILIPLALIFLLTSIVFGRIGGGEIIFKPKGAKDVIFSHESHVSDIGLKCTECHDSIFLTKEKHKKATMTDMRKGLSCGACHNGKIAFDVKANCSNCHKR